MHVPRSSGGSALGYKNERCWCGAWSCLKEGPHTQLERLGHRRWKEDDLILLRSQVIEDHWNNNELNRKGEQMWKEEEETNTQPIRHIVSYGGIYNLMEGEGRAAESSRKWIDRIYSSLHEFENPVILCWAYHILHCHYSSQLIFAVSPIIQEKWCIRAWVYPLSLLPTMEISFTKCTDKLRNHRLMSQWYQYYVICKSILYLLYKTETEGLFIILKTFFPVFFSLLVTEHQIIKTLSTTLLTPIYLVSKWL